MTKSDLIYSKTAKKMTNQYSLEFLIENFRETEILD